MISIARAPLACLVVLQLGLVSAGCELMIAGPRAKATDRWDRTYPVNRNATLAIENTNGSITVRTHDQATFQVTAHRTARAVSEQSARDLLARLSLEQSASAEGVRLAMPRMSGTSIVQHVDVRYEVLVPATAAVSLTTVNGQVDVENVTGAVELETVNGGIDARGLSSLRKAETVNGSVRVHLRGLPSEGVEIETVNGGVTVGLPGSVAASLTVDTVNGGIDVDGFNAVSDGERKRRHYEGRLNGGGPRLRVETVNGGVTVSGEATAAAPAATAQ